MTNKQSFIQAAQEALECYTGLIAPTEMVEEAMDLDIEFWEQELAEVDYHGSGPHMDTLPREKILDAIAQTAIGKTWPSYGDGPDAADEFFAELAARLK